MATGALAEAVEQPPLAALITRCDVLALDARLRLAALLGTPGHPLAFRPEELATRCLPLAPDARAAVGRAVVGGLGREALARLAPCRLDVVFPAMGGRPGGPAAHRLPVRLLSVLEREGAAGWAALGSRTIGEVSGWHGLGPAAAATLVGSVVEAALAFLAHDGGDPLAGPASPPGDDGTTGQPGRSMDLRGGAAGEAGDLALLLGYEQQCPGEGGGLRSAILRLAGPSLPPPVRAAAQRLLACPVAADRPPTVLAAAERALGTLGDVRDRVVFEQGSLLVDHRTTPTRLGTDLAISAERVRQLRCRAEARVRAALGDGPAELREAVAAVATEIGSALPRTSVDVVLGRRGLPALPDPRSLLVLWAAGPYRPVVGSPAWLATDPDGLGPSTTGLVSEDGGVRPVEHLLREIERLGVQPGAAAGWLAEQPVRVHEGLAVLTTGAPADVAERALSATAQAMTSDELSRWVCIPGDGARAAASTAALRDVLRRDRRFVEVGRDRYELAEWGAQPYHDVVPEAAGPGEPGEWGRAHDGRWWLQVLVGEDVLAGSGGPVPAGLVDGVGLRPGARRSFSTRYGPVMLTQAASGPARGSLRPVALATGAAAGDVLVLRFRPSDGVASVELVRAAAAAS